MSAATDYERAGRPDRVTVLDSGASTFTPLTTNVWAEVMLVGGGGSGPGGNTNTSNFTSGGSGGQVLITRLRLTGTVDYSVAAPVAGGAPGADGQYGNNTTFGPLVALGGRPGTIGTPSAGPAGGGYDVAASPACAVPCGDGLPGGSGGCGSGQPGPGRGPGLAAPIGLTDVATNGGTGGAVGATAGSYKGGSGGGSSLDGRGGDGGDGNNAGIASNGDPGADYGGGGGAGGQGSTSGGSGGAGAGGRIVIREFAEPAP